MKKLILVMTVIYSISLFAQNKHYEQVTRPEFKPDAADAYNPVGYPGNRVVKVQKKACEKADVLRLQIPGTSGDEREQLLKDIRKYSGMCYLDVKVDDNNDVVGISFENDTKNKINPRTAEFNSTRSYDFNFEARSKQDMHLHITENSGLTGKMSHDLLETKVIFIPRRVVPYLDMNHDQVDCVQKLILPTNEYILFDALTKEIIGGVLEELPMDMEESRHKRKFAGLEYSGNGIMIRADRRAGTPEHTYNVSYNVNEKINKAVITHKDKKCEVKKDMIWENTYNPDVSAYFKYATDQEFLDTVIIPLCGWNLSLDDLM